MLEKERTNRQGSEAPIEKDASGWIAKNSGLIATHVAVLLFGLVGLFAKVVALPAIILVLGRTFFSSAFLGAYLAVKRQKFALKTQGDYRGHHPCYTLDKLHAIDPSFNRSRRNTYPCNVPAVQRRARASSFSRKDARIGHRVRAGHAWRRRLHRG